MPKLRLTRASVDGLPPELREAYEYSGGAWHLRIEGEDVSTLKGRLDKAEQQLAESMVEARAVRAIEDAGGNARLLLPHLVERCRVAFTNGDYRLEILNDRGEKLVEGELVHLVDELKLRPEMAAAFSGTGGRSHEGANAPAPGFSTQGGKVILNRAGANDVETYRRARAFAKERGLEFAMEAGAVSAGSAE